MLAKGFSKPTDRVERLRSMIVDAVPCIEAERAVLITESYQATEGLPMIMRRAKSSREHFKQSYCYNPRR